MRIILAPSSISWRIPTTAHPSPMWSGCTWCSTIPGVRQQLQRSSNPLPCGRQPGWLASTTAPCKRGWIRSWKHLALTPSTASAGPGWALPTLCGAFTLQMCWPFLHRPHPLLRSCPRRSQRPAPLRWSPAPATISNGPASAGRSTGHPHRSWGMAAGTCPMIEHGEGSTFQGWLLGVPTKCRNRTIQLADPAAALKPDHRGGGGN